MERPSNTIHPSASPTMYIANSNIQIRRCFSNNVLSTRSSGPANHPNSRTHCITLKENIMSLHTSLHIHSKYHRCTRDNLTFPHIHHTSRYHRYRHRHHLVQAAHLKSPKSRKTLNNSNCKGGLYLVAVMNRQTNDVGQRPFIPSERYNQWPTRCQKMSNLHQASQPTTKLTAMLILVASGPTL